MLPTLCSCAGGNERSRGIVAGRTVAAGGDFVASGPVLSHDSFSFAFAASTWSHTEVATHQSAAYRQRLRRMRASRGKEDAGTVLTA